MKILFVGRSVFNCD